jgi:hypothetical protein
MTAAAFRAEYADWKLIRTRKVVQIVLEVPVETADEAYAVLGGMPVTGQSVWCAVARLKEGGEAHRPELHTTGHDNAPPVPAPAQPGRAKSPAQVAGYLCTLPPFWKFLREECGRAEVRDEDSAAVAVRSICGVKHRSEITKDNTGWRDLRFGFRVWEMAVV